MKIKRTNSRPVLVNAEGLAVLGDFSLVARRRPLYL